MAYNLVGKNFTPPDVRAKVTSSAKYAEDLRADGMVFCQLLLSSLPHARISNIDASEVLAMDGVIDILMADEEFTFPAPQESILTNEPMFVGRPILAVSAVDETTAADAIERIRFDFEPLPFTVQLLDALTPGGPSARPDGIPRRRAHVGAEFFPDPGERAELGLPESTRRSNGRLGLVIGFLYLGWRYFGAWGWPGSTASLRRERLRLGQSPRRRLLQGYLTGTIVPLQLAALAVVTSSVIRLPERSCAPPEFSGNLPSLTVLVYVLQFSLVAGVSEEAGFRGYMRVPLEQCYGAVAAILLVALVYRLAHFESVSFLHRLPMLFSSGVLAGFLARYSRSLGPVITARIAAVTIGFTSVAGLFGVTALYTRDTIWSAGPTTQFCVALSVFVTAAAASIVMLVKMSRLQDWPGKAVPLPSSGRRFPTVLETLAQRSSHGGRIGKMIPQIRINQHEVGLKLTSPQSEQM